MAFSCPTGEGRIARFFCTLGCATALGFVVVAASCNPLQASSTPDGGAESSDAAPSGSSPPSDAGAVAWSQRAPLPLPRTELGVAAVAGTVYAIGGYTGSVLSRVDAYDPASDTWTQKADLRTARRNFVSGVIGGKIYVASGTSFTDPNQISFIDTTEVYDPQTDSWTELAPCPIPNVFFDPDGGGVAYNLYGNLFTGGGAFHDQLYVLFTHSGPGAGTGMYAYDPATNAWSDVMPGPSYYNFGEDFATAAIGDALWVFMSPWGPGSLSGQLATWYSSSKTWVIDTPLISERSAFFTLNGKLYSAGGVTGDSGTFEATATVSSYDIAQSSWTESGTLTVGREHAGAAVLDGKVYIVGGDIPAQGTEVPSAVVEVGVPQ
jgi:kelch-like protein 18